MLGVLGLCLLGGGAAQLAGTRKEVGPPVTITECTSRKCRHMLTKVTLDADWRWLHESKGRKACYHTATDWDSDLCPDPDACAANCALEGLSEREYRNTYGVSSYRNGIQLRYLSRTKNIDKYGSRVFMMEGADAYRLFHLKNREFSFDVDVSRLPCGTNGALYFVEMDKEGSRTGNNAAGARYGTGYCDAQCPQDVKFIAGEINMQDWDNSNGYPIGHYGSCCTEMDVFEANSMATAITAHPCSIEGPQRCEGDDCGDRGRWQKFIEDKKGNIRSRGFHAKKKGKGKGKKPKKEKKNEGLCDAVGCDYTPFRLGEDSFFGPGSNYTLDSTQPFTVVTQFITGDGTDDGELVEVRRFYMQNGVVVPNSNATILGDDMGNSITPDFCKAQKDAFKEHNRFATRGGLKTIGEAFDRGMVLVMSLWDDPVDNMLWLDSTYPADRPAAPGAPRGPCQGGEFSTPDFIRSENLDAFITFTNLAFGQIGSTVRVNRRLESSDDRNYV